MDEEPPAVCTADRCTEVHRRHRHDPACDRVFFAFGCCASSVYLLNDIIDLEDDRLHPNKRHRPFASGRLPISHGLALIPVLLSISAALCLLLPLKFALILAGYYAMTLAYTFFLKRIESVDVVTLALLYTTRIFAGAAAAGIVLSNWLLTFSVFIFLSLALAKRCAELLLMRKNGKQSSAGRGYVLDDLPMLRSMGGWIGLRRRRRARLLPEHAAGLDRLCQAGHAMGLCSHSRLLGDTGLAQDRPRRDA
ncbi:UbiA family prenyltransferase [Roseibium salinum]|nr:UbiA family prenyltransferase [Roseibium salinum]